MHEEWPTNFDNNEFVEIRTIEIDGKPYLVTIDVTKALGYSNLRDAVKNIAGG